MIHTTDYEQTLGLMMSIEYINKIQSLLSQQDILSVLQGLELLEVLVDTESTLRLYIPYPQDCSDLQTLHRYMRHLNWPHYLQIQTWILGVGALYKFPWVMRIEKLMLRPQDWNAYKHLLCHLQITELHFASSRFDVVLDLEGVENIKTLRILDVDPLDIKRIPDGLRTFYCNKRYIHHVNRYFFIPRRMQKLTIFQVESDKIHFDQIMKSFVWFDVQQNQLIAPVIYYAKYKKQIQQQQIQALRAWIERNPAEFCSIVQLNHNQLQWNVNPEAPEHIKKYVQTHKKEWLSLLHKHRTDIFEEIKHNLSYPHAQADLIPWELIPFFQEFLPEMYDNILNQISIKYKNNRMYVVPQEIPWERLTLKCFASLLNINQKELEKGFYSSQGELKCWFGKNPFGKWLYKNLPSLYPYFTDRFQQLESTVTCIDFRKINIPVDIALRYFPHVQSLLFSKRNTIREMYQKIPLTYTLKEGEIVWSHTIYPHKDDRRTLFDYKWSLLQEEADVLSKIQVLNLSASQLTKIPSWVRQCRQLRHINLSANSIQFFPDFLFELPYLSSIDLRWNPHWNQNLSKAFWDWLTKIQKNHDDLSCITASTASLNKLQRILQNT